MGTVIVSPLVWRCDDAARPGIPAKQTLERLVSAAICEVHPGRGSAVRDFLEAEPRGGDDHKSHALSYLAKWYAEHGTGAFHRLLWRDEAVASALRRRLSDDGGWTRLERLVSAGPGDE